VRLTKDQLREIILEEYRRAIGEEEQPQDDATQGGEKESADGGKDVEKLEGKLEQYLTPIMKSINTVDEFTGAMTAFLKMASGHPALGANKVRMVLLGLAKKVMADSKGEQKG